MNAISLEPDTHNPFFMGRDYLCDKKEKLEETTWEEVAWLVAYGLPFNFDLCSLSVDEQQAFVAELAVALKENNGNYERPFTNLDFEKGMAVWRECAGRGKDDPPFQLKLPQAKLSQIREKYDPAKRGENALAPLPFSAPGGKFLAHTFRVIEQCIPPQATLSIETGESLDLWEAVNGDPQSFVPLVAQRLLLQMPDYASLNEKERYFAQIEMEQVLWDNVSMDQFLGKIEIPYLRATEVVVTARGLARLSLRDLFDYASQEVSIERHYYNALAYLQFVAEGKCFHAELTAAAYFRMGYIYEHFLEDHKEALQYYQKAADYVPKTPTAAQALFASAEVMTGLGQYQQAIAVYQQIIDTFPSEKPWRAAARLFMGNIHLTYLSDKKQAQQYFKELAEEFPNSPFSKLAEQALTAKPLSTQKRMEECQHFEVDECRRIIADFPDSQWSREAIFWVGMDFYSDLRFAEAAARFQEYLANANPEAKWLLGPAQFMLGDSLLQQGHYDEALQYLLEAEKNLRVPKGDKEQRIYRLLVGWFEPERSFRVLKMMLECAIGDIYLSRGDKGKALIHYLEAEKAAREFPYAIELTLKIANAFAYWFGDQNRALELYQRVKGAGMRREFSCYYSCVQLTDGFEKQYVDFSRRAAALELARFYYQTGKREAAWKAFGEVIARNEKDSFSNQARLAMGFIRLQECDFAGTALIWAEIDKNSPEKKVADLLEALYGPNSLFQKIFHRQINPELNEEVYENSLDGRKVSLVFVHGFPVTYVPGQVEMTAQGLKLIYDQGFFSLFPMPALSVMRNNLLLKAQAEIPMGFLHNAEVIFPVEFVWGSAAVFAHKPAVVLNAPRGLTLPVLHHELGHFYDLATTGEWSDLFDLSTLFRSISSYQIGNNFYLKTRDYGDFFGGNAGFYYYSRPVEDLAFLTAAYQFNSRLRKKALAEMQRGNFELALKYLFMRFLTPFGGEEYSVGEKNPPLGFGELQEELSKWHTRKPGKVSPDTRAILQRMALKHFLGFDVY